MFTETSLTSYRPKTYQTPQQFHLRSTFYSMLIYSVKENSSGKQRITVRSLKICRPSEMATLNQDSLVSKI